jgi:hypothetical protein
MNAELTAAVAALRLSSVLMKKRRQASRRRTAAEIPAKACPREDGAAILVLNRCGIPDPRFRGDFDGAGVNIHACVFIGAGPFRGVGAPPVKHAMTSQRRRKDGWRWLGRVAEYSGIAVLEREILRGLSRPGKRGPPA